MRAGTDGWMAAAGMPVEESPGFTGSGCWITSSGGDPRESATENKPHAAFRGCYARVKRCGKSAPQVW